MTSITGILIDNNHVVCVGFDISHSAKEFYKSFGPGSSYDSSASSLYVEREVHSSYPINGPWLNRTMRRFIQLYSDGKTAADVIDDTFDDPDCIARAMPLLLLYTGWH